jgi:CheY-like chemotaxis protein
MLVYGGKNRSRRVDVGKLKPKLLIVDDEPVTRTLLTQIFSNLGHDVKTAEDGFSALEQIRADVPDVLLSDLNMPGMSGFELLSVVRRRIPEIYVIATSGAFTGDRVPHGIAADAFYEKATGLPSLFQLMQSAAAPEQPPRAGSSASTPIWISPTDRDASSKAQVLISCPQCLRAFPLAVDAADFVIHETACVYCDIIIHYATVHPMDPAAPHQFHAQLNGKAAPSIEAIQNELAEECVTNS